MRKNILSFIFGLALALNACVPIETQESALEPTTLPTSPSPSSTPPKLAPIKSEEPQFQHPQPQAWDVPQTPLEILRLELEDIKTYSPENFHDYTLLWNQHETDTQLAELFGAPQNYQVTRFVSPLSPEALQIARSQSGVIYLKHIDSSAGISVIDLENGPIKPILDLFEIPSSFQIVGGPGDAVFVRIHDEMWLLYPDGSHEVWSKPCEGTPFFYSQDGRLIGASEDNKKVIQYHQDEKPITLADGFEHIQDIVILENETLLVSDWETGDITRINSSGERSILLDNIIQRDPLILEMDHQNQVFLYSIATGFCMLDPETGTLTRMDNVQGQLQHTPSFVFVPPSGIVLIGLTSAAVGWADMEMDETGIIAPSMGVNSEKTKIGPDGTLYTLTERFGSPPTNKILNIDRLGNSKIIFEAAQIENFAFNADGSLYFFGSTDNTDQHGLYFLPPDGSQAEFRCQMDYKISRSFGVDSQTGWLFGYEPEQNRVIVLNDSCQLIHEYALDLPKEPLTVVLAGGSGSKAYGYSSEKERNLTGPIIERWIFEIDLLTGSFKILNQFNLEHFIGVMGQIRVDSVGEIWVISGPEVFQVNKNGLMTKFVEAVVMDPAAVNSDGQGQIYISSTAGIFLIYHVGGG